MNEKEFSLLSYKEERLLTAEEKEKYYEELRDYCKARPLKTTTKGARNVAPKLRSVTIKIALWLIRILCDNKDVVIEVDGYENVPDGSVIFARSHQGVLDGFVWIPELDRHCVILHSADVNKLLLLCQYNTGLVLVKKGNKQNNLDAKLDMIRLLGEGHSVTYFPEGAWNLSPNKLMLALNYFGRKITYSTLFANIEKTAKAFAASGIRKGDVVTIISMHTPEVIYCIYALSYLGAIANMAYLTLSEQETVSVTHKTKSKMLIYLDTINKKIECIKEELKVEKMIEISPADSMPTFGRLGYCIKNQSSQKTEKILSWKDFLKLAENLSTVEENPYIKETPVIIVYTSGTTGEPKGVVLSNDNLNAIAHEYRISGMEFEREDSFLNILPPFLGFGCSVGMHLSLSLGMQEILWIQPETEQIVAAFFKYKPNHFAAAPITMKKIVEGLNGDTSYIKTFSVGGESPSVKEQEQANEFFTLHGSNAKYITGYGMTESCATMCACMNHAYKIGSLGIPLPNVNMKIIDIESREECTYHEVGEICFCTPGMMLGYYQNKKATSEVIQTHEDGIRWLHTGDLGSVDEDGFLYFKGRMKRIYFTEGRDELICKLFPARVEELLGQYPGVQNCGVIVKEDAQRIHVCEAFVTLKDDVQNKSYFEEALMQYAKEKLPEHSVPAKITVLDEMPLTQSGKVDYQKLKEMK